MLASLGWLLPCHFRCWQQGSGHVTREIHDSSASLAGAARLTMKNQPISPPVSPSSIAGRHPLVNLPLES